MEPGEKESHIRILINDLLRAAGWDIRDPKTVGTEVRLEIDVSEVSENRMGEPFIVSRQADYALFDRRGRPLAVVEAKRTALDPYVAKQQVLPYAKALGAPFIFLSNGDVIYFWDWQNEDARLISAFYSQEDLERLVFMRENQKPLATVPIPEHYLRTGESRTVRPYQRESMKALDLAVETRRRRFLLELPTGCGKTDLIALYLKRLFEGDRCNRALILVDREQLAKQALEAIQDLLPAQSSYWLKAGMAPLPGMEITVCLLQTMVNHYRSYTSGFFDVIIADECHRSIYGAWQASLTHFDAFHIGLTATPAAYVERNTFRFYHCQDQQPDFSFPIETAIEKRFLCGWRFAEGVTQMIAQGVEKDEQFYSSAEFERLWTNEDTNRKMMAEFDRLAHANARELAPGLPAKDGAGKGIVFAINKSHAARLARYLNDLHPEAKGRYAEVITSDVADADALIRRFKREAFPKVAVSVDMLTTGFDCREVLHIVLCRPIRSRILYEQIRGRGTRLAPHIGKESFCIYDFFRNKEFFEDANQADHGTGSGSSSSSTSPRENSLVEIGVEDRWLQALAYVEVGPEGERFPKRDYVSSWEKTIRAQAGDDPLLTKIRDGQPLTAEEEADLTSRLNAPRHYFNSDNLSHAYDHDSGTIVDFVRMALGSHKIKTREEQMEENFHAWLITRDFSPRQADYLILLKNRGIARGALGMNDLFEPPLVLMNAAALGVELFGKTGLPNVIAELNESVFPDARTA